MELDALLFDQIHRYLSKTMTPDERQAFEVAMKANPSLNKEVITQQRIRDGFGVLRYRQILTDIRCNLNQQEVLWKPVHLLQAADTTPNYARPEPPIRPLGWVPYASAACVALLLAGILLMLQRHATKSTPTARQNQPVLPTTVPDKYIKAARPSTKRQPSTQTSSSNEVYLALADRYLTISLRLNTAMPPPDDDRDGLVMPATDGTVDTSAIRQGLQLLKTGSSKAAIAILKPATRITLPDWQANAQWLLALAYLRNNQPMLARQQLRQLSRNPANPFPNEVQQLQHVLHE